jgi:large subunit ribosomal protein L24
MKTKLKKNDTVTVIAGKDKGKTGRVLRINRETGRVLVEGINMVKKAQRKQRQEDTGGIIEKEAPIAISNVMYVGKDGKPSRLGFRVEGGEKVRFSKKTGETV